MSLRDRLRGAVVHALLGDGVAAANRGIRRSFRFGPPRLVLFWQADDPYSYFLTQLVRQLGIGKLAIELVAVPQAGRDVDPEPELRRAFLLRDAGELARHYALDWPEAVALPDRASARRAEQAVLAAGGRARLDVALEAGRALFGGDEAALAALTRRGAVGEGQHAELLAQGGKRLRSAGHYHPGTIAYEGECYAGVDRFAYLEDRLTTEGVAGEPVLRRREPPLAPAAAPARELELYFSFRSPYSYLALARASELARRYDLPLAIKPVMPMAMRGLSVPAQKRLYILRDARREAERHGIPFGRVCDPLGAGIERCMAAYLHACEHDRAAALVESAARGIWSEALNVARDDDLRIIVERAGLGWADTAAVLRDESWRPLVERHAAELRALGLWGVPSFRLGDFSTWGQDRFFALEDRLSAR